MSEEPFYLKPEFWFAFAVMAFVVLVIVGTFFSGDYSANESRNLQGGSPW